MDSERMNPMGERWQALTDKHFYGVFSEQHYSIDLS